MTDLQVLPNVSYDYDRYDEMEFLQRIRKHAADSAGAHVYKVFPSSRSHAYVVSPRPLPPTKVKRIFHQHVVELATEEMRYGATAQDIRDQFGLSGCNISQIAKKLGIKLPRGWFSAILATEKRRERQSMKGIGPKAQAEVASPLTTPSVGRDPHCAPDSNPDRTANISVA